MGYFTDYPKHVFLILSNEFCERFSYYGMKSILVIYFKFALDFDSNTATALYHSFSAVCYFTPLIGAMIADGWLGKFRTILYLSIIYAIGSIVMTVTAIPINGEWIQWTPFIGLAIIAFGTGGIKPCVSAFGGDQFKTGQERQKESFFSLFYMAINIGSLLSTIITPLIRENVKCFGQDCYAVAFGIPAALMIVAIVVFAIGSRWYTKIPPGESILARMFGCIGTAIRGKCGCCSKGPKEKKDHWLDYAEHKYDKRFIADVKDVLKVCWLFLPLPVFWALFDQQGSRWTLQATTMNGDFGSVVMLPDMMQVMNALLVVIFVPILESLVYPCLNKLKIPNRPLQRMGLGMILAGTAFAGAGILQIFIDNESPNQVTGTTQIRFNFLNSGPCGIHVQPFNDLTTEGVDIEAYSNTEYYYEVFDVNEVFMFDADCPAGVRRQFNASMADAAPGNAYQIVLTETAATWFPQYINDFTADLNCSFRIYNGLTYPSSVSLVQDKDHTYTFNDTAPGNFSFYEESDKLESFKITYTVPGEDGVRTIEKAEFDLQNGALYTIFLYDDVLVANPAVTAKQLTEMSPRGINIFLQVPQYVIMTLGECLFSVTGLGFAYTQAAPSMKSILTSMWLLTVAIGNVVVIIVAETGTGMSQMAEFFLFAGLMYVTTVVFAIMCMFYEYVVPRDDWSSDDTSSTSSGSSKSSKSSKNSKDGSQMKKQDAIFVDEVVLKKVKDIGDEGYNGPQGTSSEDSSSVSSSGSDTKF